MKKVSKLFSAMNSMALTCTLAMACLAIPAAIAQNGPSSSYEDGQDGVPVGGKWMQFQSEDKMTAAKQVRFELLANNYLSSAPDYKPRIELTCTNNKYT